ncbi:peptidoglycan/LPS O-acetylase OafA/YrhL [Mucilaginibacter sp. UYCu711]
MIENFAHAAVIIFFVLSGYVIAYTTTIKNRGGVQYMIARFSRLYSIVLPALVITAICQYIVYLNSPELYALYTRGASWPRYFAAALFLNEIWFLSAAPPMDMPLWSLGYEFCFYMIFGLWFYRKPGLKYILLPLLACFIVGPKILSMMSIWLVGYCAYKLRVPDTKRIILNILVMLAFVVAGNLVLYLPALPFQLGTPPLFYASRFISDLFIGLFIGIALWLLPEGKAGIKQPQSIILLRIIADLTFPLYVLHTPLFILFDAIFNYKVHAIVQLWLPFVFTLSLSFLIGFVLEKQRFFWSKLFKFLFNYINVKLNI